MAASRGRAAAGPASQHARPSDRVNPKTIDPFKDSKKKSAFATVYSNGGIPCRLMHGSVKHKLAWSQSVDSVPFDPVLVLLAEGISETVHPYSFVARVGFQELLTACDATSKTIPLLPKLAASLRTALVSGGDGVFTAGMQAVVELSAVVGAALNPHLKLLLTAMSRQMMNKQHEQYITAALQQIEENCGQDCVPIIKSKIPTYTSSVC